MIARALPGAPDPWAARDAYVDVVIGARTRPRSPREWLGGGTRGQAVRRPSSTVMAAQRWRLAMFASCGWFWETPDRLETGLVIRRATHAARLIDGLGRRDLATALALGPAAMGGR